MAELNEEGFRVLRGRRNRVFRSDSTVNRIRNFGPQFHKSVNVHFSLKKK